MGESEGEWESRGERGKERGEVGKSDGEGGNAVAVVTGASC